ncbi:MAG TPA: LysM domain-containing protein [Anaeromyxobacter sp.]
MIRTNVVALLALAPALALGQAKTAAPPDPGGAPPPAAARDAAPPPLAVDVQTPSAEAAPPPDTYTVKPGDTLWDLSGRFLNNPWYWPKIWSYNPEITNPHWIYPGNLLKFFPGAEEAPTRVEPIGPGTPLAEAQPGDETVAEAEEEPEPVKELEDLSRAELKAPVEQSDEVAVAGPYKIGFAPQRQRFARHETFVTPAELAESGTIKAAFEEKKLLSMLDKVYIQFETPAAVKVGETYVIYRTEREVRRPGSREILGYQSNVIGSAKVVAVDDRAVTATIVQSLDTIERGALLGPWTQKFFRPIERRPNRQAVEGSVFAAHLDVVTNLGENHVVFVDRGEKDGVQEGNVFTVLRSGDQYKTKPDRATWDESLPVEKIGDLLVVDVKENASTALVLKSVKEVMIGDRVQMRPENGSGGN